MEKNINLTALKFIDLTHSLSSDIAQWDASCGFKLNTMPDYLDNSGEVTFKIQKVDMFVGIGTHMDAPAHCILGGKTVDQISLQQLISPCVVIDVSDKLSEKYKVAADDIYEFENSNGMIPKDSFVIMHTGWSKFWDKPEKYRNNLVFPGVSEAAAKLLFERGVVGIGIDTLSPDAIDSGFPVHRLFLGAGKYIIENIANADQLPAVGSFVFALPIKIKGGTEAPIRLIALAEKH